MFLEIPDYTNEEGDGLLRVPARWEICDSCDGHGRSSAYLGCFTASEFHEAFDYDESRDYFNGAYDRPCGECGGTGKVKVVDENHCPPEALEAYHRHQHEEACYASECAAERRMGA